MEPCYVIMMHVFLELNPVVAPTQPAPGYHSIHDTGVCQSQVALM